MIDSKSRYTLSLLAALLLAGCASDAALQRQATPLDGARYGVDAAAQAPASAQGRWWRALHNPEIDRLVAAAEAGHPSLDAARARIRQASAALAATDAQAMPQLSLGGDVERTRSSEYGILPPPLSGHWYTVKSLSLDLGWRLDLWGRLREEARAARLQRDALELEAQATRQWLASALVAQYLELTGSRAEAAALDAALAAAGQQQAYAGALARSGIVSADSADAARAQRQALAAQREQLKAREAAARHALAAISTLPQREIDALKAAQLPDWPLDARALTTAALAKRPDLQAALANVKASEHGVEAARLAYYPDVTLGAFAGLSAQHLGDLFKHGALSAGLVPGFTLPVFDAGALDAQLQARSAGRDAAIASYNQTLLQAVREAADGVSNTEAAQAAEREVREAHAALEANARRSQARVRAGLAAPAQAADATRQSALALQQLAAARTRTLQAQAALMRALAVPEHD